MTYLIKIKFAGDRRELFLTEVGQPVEVDESRLEAQLAELRAGEGMLGDLFDSHSNRWNVESVRAIPLVTENGSDATERIIVEYDEVMNTREVRVYHSHPSCGHDGIRWQWMLGKAREGFERRMTGAEDDPEINMISMEGK